MTTKTLRPSGTADGIADLDPLQVEDQTYSTRRRRHLFDVGAAITLMLALAALVRADLVVPGVPAGLGRPAMVVGFFLSLTWVIARVHPRLVVRGPQPLRWAAAGYLGALALAYTAGHLRGLTSLEAAGADRAILMSAIFLGVILVCADNISSRRRLDEILQALVALSAIMALIGLIQSLTQLNIVNYVTVPGLVNHHGVDLTADLSSGFRERGHLHQVKSTARHYIEFSAVMALALPIAIHFARFSRTRPGRQWAFLAAVVIGTVIPLTIARTGILAATVGLMVLALCWTLRTTFNLLVVVASVMAALTIVRPGVLGTVRASFLHMDNDPSIEGRTEDYEAATAYFAERPWLGRGPGTFIPTMYDWIDNEWLLHVITTGVAGTVALAAIHAIAVTLALIARFRARSERDRDLSACLIAVQVMAVLMSGTYDSLNFTTHLIVLAVLTGASGALWRFTHPARQIRSASASPLNYR